MRIFRKLAQLLDVDLVTTAPADGDSLTYDSASSKWVPEAVSGGGGGGAPTDATYITQTANAGLDSEQALSALATGLVKVTNGTGVLSTATGGTDYANASHQHAGEDITSGTVADARIASTIARDSEVTSAISALSSVYQAKDTTLDTYAGIDPAANVQSILSAADYAAIRTLLGLVIGTNVQAFDADLSTWAGLTPSAFFQTLVDDADAATARATLGVIASLFQSGGAQAIKLDDLAAPDDNTDLDASTSKHGLLKKLPGGTSTFLRADGTFASPPGGALTIAYESRSSNTILGTSDNAKTIELTATFTQTFDAAATLAAGWWVILRAKGSGTVVTLDPNSSELIDGLVTQRLCQGAEILVMCDGSAFHCTTLQGVYKPEDVPGLCGWWDATDSGTITQSGGAVSQWNDKSASGYNVVQATGTAKPTTGTRTINSLNTLDFDGGDNLAKSSGVLRQSPYGVYVVVEPDTVASGERTIIHSGASGSADWGLAILANDPFFHTSDSPIATDAAVASTAMLVVGRIVSSNTTYCRAAGVLSSLAATPSQSGYANVEIGSNNTPGNYFDGKIGEIIWVGTLVSAEADLAIRNYLANKWGVTA